MDLEPPTPGGPGQRWNIFEMFRLLLTWLLSCRLSLRLHRWQSKNWDQICLNTINNLLSHPAQVHPCLHLTQPVLHSLHRCFFMTQSLGLSLLTTFGHTINIPDSRSSVTLYILTGEMLIHCTVLYLLYLSLSQSGIMIDKDNNMEI